MSESRFKKYMKRHLLNESNGRARSPFAKGVEGPINQGVEFDEFMENLRNYSSDTDRDEMLTFLTKQIIQDYTTSDLRGLMAIMADEFQRDGDGNHFTGTMDVNETSLNEAVYTKDDILELRNGDSIVLTGEKEEWLKHFTEANLPPVNMPLELVGSKPVRGGSLAFFEDLYGNEVSIHISFLAVIPQFVKEIIKA